MDAAVDAIILQFDTDWPQPYTQARCGDGTLDIEFGEECDDGNNVNGDGCSRNCEIE